MDTALAVVTGLLLAGGCFLSVVASIGVVRFPDFYSRMHPAGKIDTLGHSLILLGLMVREGFTLVTVKLIVIMVFIHVANPTATHALAKAAYDAGVRPWQKGEPRR
jgi:multicomponent Na+:H+ antiporter subunit G